MPSLLSYRLVVPDWPLALTFITKEMLKRGFISNDRIYANFSHSPFLIKRFKIAITEVFNELSNKITTKTLLNSVPDGVKTMGFDKVRK